MSRHTTRVRTGNDRASLYTEITDKIIAELEASRITLGAAMGNGGDQGATRDAAQRCHAARILRPQGTRLIGIYDSQVAFGQSRVLLVWTRLIMPNGRSIVLERQPGADTAGYAGLEDEVDNHWGALFKAALLSTLLGVGSELGSTTGTGSNSDVISALRRGSSDSLNQTGQKVVQQNLNIQPTLTVRPGFPVRVIVNRDLVLEPYKG
jgi:type IV secretory pathway VirB10-like protein